jgi:hypothetical protein
LWYKAAAEQGSLAQPEYHKTILWQFFGACHLVLTNRFNSFFNFLKATSSFSISTTLNVQYIRLFRLSMQVWQKRKKMREDFLIFS